MKKTPVFTRIQIHTFEKLPYSEVYILVFKLGLGLRATEGCGPARSRPRPSVHPHIKALGRRNTRTSEKVQIIKLRWQVHAKVNSSGQGYLIYR